MSIYLFVKPDEISSFTYIFKFLSSMLDKKCKICRRVGQKLFLKGERCFSPKCAMVKRAYPPGIHGKSRKRRSLSEYGIQFREKQKIRKSYRISDKQLKNYFKEGQSIEELFQKLERRLDNVVLKLGFAGSRNSARLLVDHGHFLVNKRRVNIPSYQVGVGDIIIIKKTSRDKAPFKDLSITLKKYETPSWLSLDKKNLEGKVLSLPVLKEASLPGELRLVREFYSR